MNFSRPFIERPIGTTLLALGLLLLGIVAYRFLPVASLPSVEFPTIRVTASRPGADPETMAATRRGAARAAARRDRRRHRDDLGELARLHAHLDPVRPHPRASTAPRATCRRRSTPRQPTCRATCRSLPSFRKSNPAAAPILILALTSKTLPAERPLRRGRHRHRPAHLAGRRRGRGDGRRRRAAGHPRARQSHAAVLDRAQRRGRAHGDHQRQRAGAARHHRRPDRRPPPSRPTPSCARSRTTATSSSRRRTATSCACRKWPTVEQSNAQLARGGHVQRPAGDPAHHHQAGATPTSSRRSTASAS